MEPPEPAVRVLLVDDNVEFLESAARYLSSHPGIQVVGRALSGEEALRQVALLRPDLVLMDLSMPGMGGLKATEKIKEEADAPRVVMLTLYDSLEYRTTSLAVGADGFINKSELCSDLLPVMDALFSGRLAG